MIELVEKLQYAKKAVMTMLEDADASVDFHGLTYWAAYIYGQPSNLTVSAGATASFSVLASGSPTPETLRSLRRKTHQALRRVTRNFEQFEFNTIISSLMELLNEMYKAREAGAAGSKEWIEAQQLYLKMMAPVAPHIAEELWAEIGQKYSIHTQSWPAVDEEAAKEDEVSIAVQINGKVRDRITVAADASDETVQAAALAAEGVIRALEGKSPRKIIVIKGKLVSIVV